jgi:hypothetical protein
MDRRQDSGCEFIYLLGNLSINTTFLVLSWDGMGIERGGVNMIKDKKKEHIVMMIIASAFIRQYVFHM